ncbi:MAG: hypothetical protein KKH28_02120 [Elusimicrobia bacterium]|nr:hypothetical protein [Elusimicrobiota bacterium]
MHKTGILIILLGMALFSGCGAPKEESKPTPATGETKPKEKYKSTTAVEIKWKGTVTEADLVKVANFLINNKGKEIELTGEKHVITGKEELDVEITVLPCCDEKMFHKSISTFGIVRDVKFPTFHATVPANAIPEIDKNGEITAIKFESRARELWMNAVKQ